MRKLLSVVALAGLLVVFVVSYGPLPVESTTTKATTAAQASIKMLYGHQGMDQFSFTWGAGDTTAGGLIRDTTWVIHFYQAGDSTNEWENPASEMLLDCATAACTLKVHGSSTHWIDHDPWILNAGESITLYARVESVWVRFSAAGTFRGWAYGD